MSKEILNKDPRPQCRVHEERTGQLGSESKTRDPQAGHTGGGGRPGGARDYSPWRRGRRAAVAPDTESLRAAPRTRKRETRGHSCTSHTEQHQAPRSFTRARRQKTEWSVHCAT